jgi:hypothetical protein
VETVVPLGALIGVTGAAGKNKGNRVKHVYAQEEGDKGKYQAWISNHWFRRMLVPILHPLHHLSFHTPKIIRRE